VIEAIMRAMNQINSKRFIVPANTYWLGYYYFVDK
jgi:hypothetical protein